MTDDIFIGNSHYYKHLGEWRLKALTGGAYDAYTNECCSVLLDEIERLRSIIESQNTKIKTLGRAIRNAGPQPKLHASIMRKHRKEWPTLWKAIDSLLQSDTSYDNRK